MPPTGTRTRSPVPNPREKRRSTKCWTTISTLVIARYQMHAATSMGKTRNVRLPIACSWKNSSLVTGTKATSAVSLSIAIVSLPVGGMMTRIACGSTMRRNVSSRLIPSACAASVWPGSMDWMPARTISAM